MAIVSNEQDKMNELRKLMQQSQQGDRLLIFCETKRGCAFLARQLSHVEGVPAMAIHGDLEQREREVAVRLFILGGGLCCGGVEDF